MERRLDTIYLQFVLTSRVVEEKNEDVNGDFDALVEIRVDADTRLFGFDGLDASIVRSLGVSAGGGTNECACFRGCTLLYLNITPYGDVMLKFREPIDAREFIDWIDHRPPGPLKLRVRTSKYIDRVVDDVVPISIRKSEFGHGKVVSEFVPRGPEWVPAISRGEVTKYLTMIGLETVEARCIANATDIMFNARDGRLRLSRRAIGPVIKSRAVRMDWGNFFAIEFPGDASLPVGYLATIAYDEFLAFYRLDRCEGGAWKLVDCDHDAIARERWWISRTMMYVNGWCSDISYMRDIDDWGFRRWRTNFPDVVTKHIEYIDLQGVEDIDLDSTADHNVRELTSIDDGAKALRRFRTAVTDDLVAQVQTFAPDDDNRKPERAMSVDQRIAFYAERMPAIGCDNRYLAVAVDFVNCGHCLSLRPRIEGAEPYTGLSFSFDIDKFPTIPIYGSCRDAELQALQFLGEKFMLVRDEGASVGSFRLVARSDDMSTPKPDTINLPHSPLEITRVPVSLAAVPYVEAGATIDYICLSSMCRYAYDYVGVLGPLYAATYGFYHDADSNELWLRLRDQAPFRKKIDVSAFPKSYCVKYADGADIVALQCRMFAGIVSNLRFDIVDRSNYAVRLRDSMLDCSVSLAALWYNVIRGAHVGTDFILLAQSAVLSDYLDCLPPMTFGDVIPVSRGPSIYGPQVNYGGANLPAVNVYADRKSMAIDRIRATDVDGDEVMKDVDVVREPRCCGHGGSECD